MLAKRQVVFESCGMGWRLAELLNLPTIKRRQMITIAFVCDPEVLHDRLRHRQKRPLPEPFLPEDEHLAIDYAATHFYEEVIVQPECIFDTTNQKEYETYELVTQCINQMRLFRQGRNTKRRADFMANKPVPSRNRWRQEERVKDL